jgi:tRNA A37 threonylcarbamoyladenosine synthetase subunit TsaC/SUA5/YrdC
MAARHFGDVTRADTGTRDGIRRRLEKYAGNPAACKEKGTTTKRVKQALRNFLAGHPAQACVRDAGLASPNQGKDARIRVNCPAHEVARRLIKSLGESEAAAVAAAITQQLTENNK